MSEANTTPPPFKPSGWRDIERCNQLWIAYAEKIGDAKLAKILRLRMISLAKRFPLCKCSSNCDSLPWPPLS